MNQREARRVARRLAAGLVHEGRSDMTNPMIQQECDKYSEDDWNKVQDEMYGIAVTLEGRK